MIYSNTLYINTEPVEAAFVLDQSGQNIVNGFKVYSYTDNLSFYPRLKLAFRVFWFVFWKRRNIEPKED